jgi:hypothetical protein
MPIGRGEAAWGVMAWVCMMTPRKKMKNDERRYYFYGYTASIVGVWARRAKHGKFSVMKTARYEQERSNISISIEEQNNTKERQIKMLYTPVIKASTAVTTTKVR